MTIGLPKNQKYENWLKANKYEEGMIHGNSMSIVREDGNDIWTDDSGHSFLRTAHIVSSGLRFMHLKVQTQSTIKVSQKLKLFSLH